MVNGILLWGKVIHLVIYLLRNGRESRGNSVFGEKVDVEGVNGKFGR